MSSERDLSRIASMVQRIALPIIHQGVANNLKLLLSSEEDPGGHADIISTMSSERELSRIASLGQCLVLSINHQGVAIDLKFLLSSEEGTSGLADKISTLTQKGISAELRVWDNALL